MTESETIARSRYVRHYIWCIIVVLTIGLTRNLRTVPLISLQKLYGAPAKLYAAYMHFSLNGKVFHDVFKEASTMTFVFFVGGTAFFVLSVAFVVFCERLRESGQ